MQTGRIRRKLAEKLQANFPVSVSGVVLTWKPENLYPATGAYRTDFRLDCWRWEGYAKHVRQDGSEYTVLSVGGYTTMTDLIKANELMLHPDGEITAFFKSTN